MSPAPDRDLANPGPPQRGLRERGQRHRAPLTGDHAAKVAAQGGQNQVKRPGWGLKDFIFLIVEAPSAPSPRGREGLGGGRGGGRGAARPPPTPAPRRDTRAVSRRLPL